MNNNITSNPASTSLVTKVTNFTAILCTTALIAISTQSIAAPSLKQEIRVTNSALHFDGVKKSSVNAARNDPDAGPGQYDYMYGTALAPHGDAIKTYKNYVFMTWYKGGKYNRHVMLTRYNKDTGTSVDIEFPHQHTGFEGRWWVGETHNTIAVGISPKNDTIHLLYDMHAYHSGTNTGGNGSFAKDYFRYSYSVAGAATVPDSQFNLNKFVKDTSSSREGSNDYKHLTMTGTENHSAFARLTYPKFFLNDSGDLFMHMRQGTSHDGRIVFNKYDGNSKWGNFKSFNSLGAQAKGDTHNWSIYGVMKYVDGKIRTAFQRRLSHGGDKYKYQNGVYYAYSNNQTGASNWKNHRGQSLSMPMIDATPALVMEPGNLVDTTAQNKVHIVGGFDFTVTDNGDEHFIHQVKDLSTNTKVSAHTYRKAGNSNFITKTGFSSPENIYTSGENIYLVGLDNGQPYVEQAKGGTNDFVRVYEGNNANRKFTKGVVHINDGVLYYYLLENGSGDTRTTYLQIIDLDINGSDGPEGFTYAANGGGTVEVTGTMDIAFGANGQFNYINAATDNTYCHRSVFGDPIPGVVKQCYVKSVADQTVEVSFNQGEISLEEGYEQLMLSVDVDGSADIENVKLYLNGNLVRQESVAPYEWGHAGLPEELLGLTPGRYTFKAVATDVNGNEGVKFKIVNVTEASNPFGCSSVTDIAWNTETEVTLSDADSCLRFEQSLSGSTVQFWDSETNTRCDFRGSVVSADGNGSVEVTANYKQSSDFTGTTLMLAPSNSCQYIKVRAR